MRSRRHGLLLLALVPSLGIACEQESSSPGANGGSGPGAAGGGGLGGAGGSECVSGLEQATPECTACQDAHCCLTATQAATHPDSWTRSAAKICREANCWQQCNVPEPECGGIVPTPASCADDLYSACCAETTACAQSDACDALVYICVDDRGCSVSGSCLEQCAAEFPGGRDQYDAFIQCFFEDVTCT